MNGRRRNPTYNLPIGGFAFLTTNLRRDLRVLICEDEYLVAKDLAHLTETFGAKVVGTFASRANLDTALSDPDFDVDLALLDVQLIDGEVFEFVPKLQERGVSIVFCSAYPRPQGLEPHAHLPWIAKPFSSQDVHAALQRAFDARSSSQSG